MSGLSKQFLFGDALDDIDTGCLNLAEFGLNNLIEQAQKDSDDENKSENNNRENSNDNYDNLDIASDEESDINLNENDLGIETLCEDNKGKIFKFSDLIIPMDEKDILSTEKFLRKKMEKIKKDKNEKIENEEIKKREKNEEEEISKLMKRSKKNQKYCKFNIGYDEKFFDKTLFTKKDDNINNNKEKKIGENKMNIEEEEEKDKKFSLQKDFSLKKDMIHNYDDLIKNTLFQFNKNYYKNNPNDNSNNNLANNEIKESEVKLEDTYTKNFINKINEKLNQISNNENDFEEKKDEDNEIINNFINDEKQFFLGENAFMNFSKKNSKFVNEIFSKIKLMDKKRKDIFKYNQTNQKEYDFFNFNISQQHYDKYDLQDFIKRKRNRADGYINNNISLGTYMDCYVTDSIISKNFHENSRIIYDLNDYNMNFEIIEENQEGQKNETNQNINNNNVTDFFSTLPKKPNVYSQNLKFGNAKGSVITHAKCAYSFTYNKINLNYEELADFHRPNFCKYLMLDKKKEIFL